MDRINVIKVGGAVLEDKAATMEFLSRFASIPGPKVLVHGGGRLATSFCERLGIGSVMIEGRRVTDAQTLEIVTMTYAGLVNKTVVAQLQALGVNAFGICGADFSCIMSEKRPVKGGIDYGFVGDVRKVDVSVLAEMASKGIVPVVAPLTHDGKGQLLNTNADTMASETAKALAGQFDVTLTYCFEKKGVLSDPSDEDSLIKEINAESYAALKEGGTVSGGMIPKLDNAFAALKAGVGKVVITSAKNLEEGNGTSITL